MLAKAYYNQFFTLKDLMGNNLNNIKNFTLNLFSVLDGINGSEISNFIDVIFMNLKTNPSSHVYTRYEKYDDNGKVKPVSIYNDEIAQKMYQCVRKFWLQNKFFNATMDWDKINSLLTQTKKSTIKRDYENSGNIDRTKKTTGTGDNGEYIAGETQTEPVYDANYATSGYRGKYETTGTDNDKETAKGKSNISLNTENVNLKLDYLKDIYDIIDRQSNGLTRCFYNFVNYIIIPNQNIQFEVFPWPWTFTESDNL